MPGSSISLKIKEVMYRPDGAQRTPLENAAYIGFKHVTDPTLAKILREFGVEPPARKRGRLKGKKPLHI